VQRDEVRAGEIARLWGLATQIGDWIGEPQRGPEHHFAPPTLEAVVRPTDPAEANQLRVALEQLAEQDPLIDIRQDADGQLSVSLYGEVQKEVVQATLADDYGLDVDFTDTTTICVERPARTGDAVEVLKKAGNPFDATIGLRVEPVEEGRGIEFRMAAARLGVPIHLYKTHEAFSAHMEAYVREALREGLYGWQVTDCVVTMTECVYAVADGPPSRRGSTSPADYRFLTPIVLMEALDRAGSQVCEPILRCRLEVPTPAIGAVMSALARLGAAVETPTPDGEMTTMEAVLAASLVDDLQRRLPGLTGGEGVLETDFAGYRPVAGDPPRRRRTTPNPLNREEYMMHLAKRV
jgi:ribosomal protection tetracycline resistance protein